MLELDIVRALANRKRLLILEWLKDPIRQFPPQKDGDLIRDGVCSCNIADKFGDSDPTAGEHLRVLSHAGLVRRTKIKQWVFYKRDERRIRAAKQALSRAW